MRVPCRCKAQGQQYVLTSLDIKDCAICEIAAHGIENCVQQDSRRLQFNSSSNKLQWKVQKFKVQGTYGKTDKAEARTVISPSVRVPVLSEQKTDAPGCTE